MKICLDISPDVHHRAGMGRMAHEMAVALVNAAADEQWSVFYNSHSGVYPAPPLDRIPRTTIDLGNKRWRLRVMQAYALRQAQDGLIGSVDIFHATDHLLPNLQRTKAVFSLGDVTFLSHPQAHSRLNRMFLRLMMPRFLSNAYAIIAISQNTLAEMKRYYEVGLDNATVVHLGVSKRFKPIDDPATLTDVRKRYALPLDFILYVGTIEPRKNIARLIEAYANLNNQTTKLVIAGKRGWLYDDVFQLVQSHGLENDVLFPGYISDEDLPAIFSAATLFVFPSLYEGFGLPVLEAMACGVPVITSNVSSLPEVAGDAAILIDPYDIQSIRDAMQSLMDNPTKRSELSAKGLRNAAEFTWERTARQTLDIYRQLGSKR
ncbi:MAG: glycosyltransferase family 4 protein [Caldilineales bacterium]|nr:glycosyltransferase family 4 protein [Caldilineales bacterium]